MSAMTVTMTCTECGSGINILPSTDAKAAECDVCQEKIAVQFNEEHLQGVLKDCPCCQRKDFYKQKDFNRKIGVILFVLAAIASIWTYGLSLIALWMVDFFLFRKLSQIAICYKCQTIFRNVANIEDIHDFNHEMNDRIIYSDHDFEGKPLEH